jgi:hypothetical protein
MKKRYIINSLLFAGILCFFSVIYYHEMVHFWPYAFHNWAQADRLSLAINFYDRGMNFFKPATHNLNSIDGIVGVEFPLQSYSAAALAKIFGRNHISTIFRLMDVLIACTGLVFIFMSGYRATKDFVFSMVTPLFIFCSPVFIFYACNYLPDTTSASIVFIAFYFVLRYQETKQAKDMLVIIGLLTLASLVKTSATLYLIAFIAYVFSQKIFNKSKDIRHSLLFIISVCISASILAGNYFYIRYLNAKYDSHIFLSHAMPFHNWDEVRTFFNEKFKTFWIDEYLLLPQYLMLAAIVVPAFLLLLGSVEGKKRITFLAICIAGSLSVFCLMGEAFFEHEYFFIVIFLPLIGWWLLISMIAIHKEIISSRGRKLMRISLLSATVVIFFFADRHTYERLQPRYKNFNAASWAEYGSVLLQQLDIPATENILVLNDEAPNLALVYFDRRGFVLAPGNWANMGEVRAHMDGMRVRTGVCERQFCLNQQLNDTTFNKFFVLVATQNNIAVFRTRN